MPITCVINAIHYRFLHLLIASRCHFCDHRGCSQVMLSIHQSNHQRQGTCMNSGMWAQYDATQCDVSKQYDLTVIYILTLPQCHSDVLLNVHQGIDPDRSRPHRSFKHMFSSLVVFMQGSKGALIVQDGTCG